MQITGVVLSWFIENKIKVFRYIISNEHRMEQGYTDNREVTGFGEEWGGAERGKKTSFRL